MTSRKFAVYLMLEKDKKVLLLRRYNTGWNDGNYSLIAGHVKSGESARQSIILEAKEKAGITVKSDDLELVHIIHRNKTKDNSEYVDIYFKTKEWSIEFVKGPSCDKLDWFNLDKLPDNTIPVVKSVLMSIKEEKLYSDVGWD